MIVVSVDRASLSLTPLVFADPTSGLWVPEDGIGRPGKRKRNRYAGESPWIDGATLVGSTLEHGTLPLAVYVQQSSAANLDLVMGQVEAAFDQFVYDTTVTVNDGPAQTWRCDPADIEWGDVDSGMARAYMARASVVIPVFPRSS